MGKPLLVMLHGAGSNGRAMVELMGDLAAEAGMLLLAPDSAGRTWDVIEGGFGADLAAIDAAVDAVLREHDVSHVILGGFSDGASYALSLGLMDGDRFPRVVAFSPGFMAPDAMRGRPAVFVSHGVHDRVLPIAACSRRLVPMLQRAGYEVEYVEFDGGHTVPPEIARAALAWAA